MPGSFARVLPAAAALALVVLVPVAGASAGANCGSVSYTVPQTHDHGHAALNNLRAVNVSCTAARSVATTFLVRHKAPKGWHAANEMVVVHTHGQTDTVDEEILTDGRARVTGDVDN